MKPSVRIGLLTLVISGLLLLTPGDVQAAKKRVTTRSTGAVAGIGYSSAKLSRPARSIIVSLFNLSSVTKVTYELSYSTNGLPQGVVGSIVPSGQSSDSRSLYFGTCSKGVCTPHYNITDARLIVRVTLKNGRTFTKSYRIKYAG